MAVLAVTVSQLLNPSELGGGGETNMELINETVN
jgi:hypothetical protein